MKNWKMKTGCSRSKYLKAFSSKQNCSYANASVNCCLNEYHKIKHPARTYISATQNPLVLKEACCKMLKLELELLHIRHHSGYVLRVT